MQAVSTDGGINNHGPCHGDLSRFVQLALGFGSFQGSLHPREEDIIYNDLMSLGRVKSSSLRFESDRFLRILDLLHPFI
jgi:hypothetical protein